MHHFVGANGAAPQNQMPGVGGCGGGEGGGTDDGVDANTDNNSAYGAR